MQRDQQQSTEMSQDVRLFDLGHSRLFSNETFIDQQAMVGSPQS